MNYFVISNRSRGRLVADKVERADDFASRSRGLLGKDGLGAGEGMYIVPCAMIHTFFMKFPIDVVFLDRGLKAVRVIENLRPWRMSPWAWGADGVLELAGGSLRGSISVGDQLEIS
jgi:hypothetical protein